jgi:hypothetical protein
MTATESTRRNWTWDANGELLGHYVETRQVNVKSGPSAGQSKLVFDFHVGLEDESVSVWETSVLRSKLAEELKRRGKPDFEPGERMQIKPLEWKEGPNGSYRDFDVWFEHAAPKLSAAELLNAGGIDEPADDDDIPFV